jgi:hypothetical protein
MKEFLIVTAIMLIVLAVMLYVAKALIKLVDKTSK